MFICGGYDPTSSRVVIVWIPPFRRDAPIDDDARLRALQGNATAAALDSASSRAYLPHKQRFPPHRQSLYHTPHAKVKDADEIADADLATALAEADMGSGSGSGKADGGPEGLTCANGTPHHSAHTHELKIVLFGDDNTYLCVCVFCLCFLGFASLAMFAMTAMTLGEVVVEKRRRVMRCRFRVRSTEGERAPAPMVAGQRRRPQTPERRRHEKRAMYVPDDDDVPPQQQQQQQQQQRPEDPRQRPEEKKADKRPEKALKVHGADGADKRPEKADKRPEKAPKPPTTPPSAEVLAKAKHSQQVRLRTLLGHPQMAFPMMMPQVAAHDVRGRLAQACVAAAWKGKAAIKGKGKGMDIIGHGHRP